MISAAYHKLLTAIREAENKYHRPLNSVQLLAVSKGQNVNKIIEAYHAGQYAFGENYLQEALAKMALLPDKNIEWHFIGQLQRNKTRKIAEHFSWVHSVDDILLAQRLNDQRPEHLPPLNICIEVNMSHEKNKSGVAISEVLTLANACQPLPRIKLRGLMVIPAATHDVEKQRATFHQLFLLQQSLLAQSILVDTLSMGMSDDYEAAIAEGSTIVRIGSALFGARE